MLRRSGGLMRAGSDCAYFEPSIVSVLDPNYTVLNRIDRFLAQSEREQLCARVVSAAQTGTYY